MSSRLPLNSKWSNNTHLIIHESRAWHAVDAQSVPNYFYPPSKAESYTAAVTKQLVNKVLEDLVLISFCLRNRVDVGGPATLTYSTPGPRAQARNAGSQLINFQL